MLRQLLLPSKMSIRPRSLHIDDRLPVLWADRDAGQLAAMDNGAFVVAAEEHQQMQEQWRAGFGSYRVGVGLVCCALCPLLGTQYTRAG